MKLELMKEAEVPLAMEIIHMAKRHLREQGIDQWQNGYPNEASLMEDVVKKRGYFVREKRDNQTILGYLCMDFGGEPAYDSLKSWESDNDFVVVHRFAVHQKARGKGVADAMISLVEEECVRRNVNNFRIDTHENNGKMQHILMKNGFKQRGVVLLPTGERIAFDKMIKM